MIAPVKGFLAFLVGLGALARAVLKRRRKGSTPAAKLLGDLATQTSSPVPDLSSRAGLATPAALAALSELEGAGLVQLSPEKGPEHVRIAAITQAGRKEAARQASASAG